MEQKSLSRFHYTPLSKSCEYIRCLAMHNNPSASHRGIFGCMLKCEIYKDDKHMFEDLAYLALMITVMATKRKAIRNMPGYFKGVLDKLVDETYFEDIFMLFDTPVERFYCPE